MIPRSDNVIRDEPQRTYDMPITTPDSVHEVTTELIESDFTAWRTVKSFDDMPTPLKAKRQWCLWKFEFAASKTGKYLYKCVQGNWKKLPYRLDGHLAESNNPSTWASFEEVKSAYETNQEYNGVGFFFNHDFTGIDVDGSTTIPEDLVELVRYGYLEVSPSGVGLHLIVQGVTPGNKGHHKNGFEVYCAGRYFTMTGNRHSTDLTDGKIADQSNTYQIANFCNLAFETPAPTPTPTPTPEEVKEVSIATEKEATANPTPDLPTIPPPHPCGISPNSTSLANTATPTPRPMPTNLPDIIIQHPALGSAKADAWGPVVGKLTKDEVIARLIGDSGCTALWLGIVPDGKSESERDEALAFKLAFWTSRDAAMIESLMRQSKCVRPKWDEPREGSTWLDVYCIRPALERVKEGYNRGRQGPRVQISPDLILPKLTLDDKVGAIGIGDDGTLGKIDVAEDKDGHCVQVFRWISDCILVVTKETRCGDKTEFTFEGIGAKDGKKVHFKLTSKELADKGAFEEACIAAFGARNKFGKLSWKELQFFANTVYIPRQIQRIEVPVWEGNVAMIPGGFGTGDTEFSLSQNVPAKVYDGDLKAALNVLRDFMCCHEYAPLLMAHVLAGPMIARWLKNERFGMALWALTGKQKTTMAQTAMTVYGEDYASDLYLITASLQGNTSVGEEIKFVSAGFLPTIYDDLKTTNDKVVDHYVSRMHGVLEGGDKGRGTKEAKLKEAKEYLTMPIATGEIRPEDASTDARILNLTWAAPDLAILDKVQKRLNLMPIIGYHWLKHLSEITPDLKEDFVAGRTKRAEEYRRRGIVNTGRLATIYVLLRLTWNQLIESPLGKVFEEYKPAFLNGLDKAISEQAHLVNNDTELSKLLSGIRSLLASKASLIETETSGEINATVMCRQLDKGMFFIPAVTLAELNRLQVFTQQPTIDSMTKSLDAANATIRTSPNRRLAFERMNHKGVYGWYIKSEVLYPEDEPVTTKTSIGIQSINPMTTVKSLASDAL